MLRKITRTSDLNVSGANYEIINLMRRDRNTGKTYLSFWNWLFHGHVIWIIIIFFAYGWYLGSTDEVKK